VESRCYIIGGHGSSGRGGRSTEGAREGFEALVPTLSRPGQRRRRSRPMDIANGGDLLWFAGTRLLSGVGQGDYLEGSPSELRINTKNSTVEKLHP